MSSQVEVINSERQDIVPNTDGSENTYKTPILLGLVFSLVLGFIVAGVILELSYSFRVKTGQSLPTNFNGTDRKGIYLKLENKAIGMGQTPYQIAFDQTVFSCLNICSSNSSCALFSLTKLGMCQFFDLFSTNNYRNASGVSIYVKL